ncbi:hypothetical protein CQ012_02495 [Arthrobacter sp. MYb214]|uniref:hypothetical protein n=1 Tax=Arthrobacter sp. MYb214 TaxID=1848596 RepID=UPI000CFD1F81|nr:hypothetical protein [Arthrobacter sp. MYb214]PRB78278.1 hypothetical protein CQ012_02495 [Arthrobacter sp. MYb214]
MSAYKFECEVQHSNLSLYYEDDAIAVDMEPTDQHPVWGKLPKLDRPDFEAIVPVENADSLVAALQDMITEIRARQARAA